MDFETPPFSIGDVVVDERKESLIFRRDCVVVFTDPHFIGLVTEGLQRIAFITLSEAKLKLLSRGVGKLTLEQELMVKNIVSQWPDAEFLKILPQQVAESVSTLSINQEERSNQKKVYLQIGGLLSLPVVMHWRKYMAMIEMTRRSGIEIPSDIDVRIIEWMILMTTPSITSLGTTIQAVKRQFGDNSGEAK